MLLDASPDITAFADFPPAYWKKIWSTNPLERLNREIKRRVDVVQVFPNPAALDRPPPQCWPNSTTNGRPSTAATSPKPPWPSSSPPRQPNPNPRSPHNRNRSSCRDYTTPRDMTCFLGSR
ncbi:transposase [Streptomyces phaeochromogenes]|nr:transposase [Streptomyces phaeochromogenes]